MIITIHLKNGFTNMLRPYGKLNNLFQVDYPQGTKIPDVPLIPVATPVGHDFSHFHVRFLQVYLP